MQDSRTGNQLVSQSLDLWQPDEFLHVFSENGQRFADPFALKGNPGNAVHVLFPLLLEVELESSENSKWTSPDNNWQIITLSPNTNIRLLLEGELFWELKEAFEPSTELIQARAFIDQALSATASTVDIQSGLLTSTLSITKPDAMSIRWARIGFDHITFEENPIRAILPIAPATLERGVSIQFCLEEFDRRFLIRKRIHIPFEGAFWIRQDGVKWDVPRVLHTQDATLMKLCASPRNPKNDEDPKQYCITEGYHFSRRLTGSAIQLSGLNGMGCPLILQRGLFNNQFSDPQVLADAVIDGGCIHQIRISSECLTIFPSGLVELKSSFQAIAWVGSNDDMRLEHLKLSADTVADSNHKVWRAQNPYQEEHINAVGIFYEGECIGSWWNLSAWTLALRNCPDSAHAEEYANVIRVFNCPILYEENRTYIANFMQEYPVESLLNWLQTRVTLKINDNTLLRSQTGKYNQWLRAVGILVEQSNPKMDIAVVSLVLEEVSGSENALDSNSLSKAAHILTAASPILSGTLIEVWLKHYASYNGSASANSIRQDLIAALEPSEDEIEDISTNLIRADSFFVHQHCKEFGKNGFHLPPARRDNLPFLFEHSITRRLAAAEYLRHHRIQ